MALTDGFNFHFTRIYFSEIVNLLMHIVSKWSDTSQEK